MAQDGTIKQVMAFFGFKKVADFRKEWNTLSGQEQEWFKAEVAKIA